MAYYVKHVSLYVKHVFTRKAAAKLEASNLEAWRLGLDWSDC